jgi:MraZ protein
MWENGGEAEPRAKLLPDISDVAGPCFLGRFAHTLDEKRRVAIPKTFREELTAADGESFFLFPAFDPCLWMFTERRFKELKTRLTRMQDPSYGVGDTKIRAFRREIFSRCAKLTPDKQGRIALPPELCKAVGIDKEVVFLGVDERIELWAPGAEDVRDDPERLRRLSREILG